MNHPLFSKRFFDVKLRSIRNLLNGFLSDGGAGYYFLAEGIRTRLYLYNYFALLSGNSFPAEWQVRFYSTDGLRSRTVRGKFEGEETVVLDAERYAQGLGDMGICIAHIRPMKGSFSMKVSYQTIFFMEFFTPSGRSFIHSFAYPVPKLYQAHDILISSMTPTADSFLLVSNSCDRFFGAPAIIRKRGFSIELENYRGDMRRVELPPVTPLSCRIIHFRELWKDLGDFLGDEPAIINISGPNLLYSPLFVQKNIKGSVAMEHFQGLMWEDIPAGSGR